MSKQNIERVQAMYAAFGRRDFPAITAMLAEDFTAEQSTELPWGGVYQGTAGLASFFERLTRHVNSSLVFDRFLDAGDHVVVIGWTRGQIVATGRPFDVPIAHVWRLRDDRIVAFRPFIDNPTMLAALAAGRS
jgi:uncharacterized protein